jgi:DNA modification methylase
MIGISTICNNYTCFEPSTRTSDGLINLAVFIKKFRPEFNASVNVLPFEDSHLTEEYDFALTSPPYYDTEIYTDEKSNSLNRYDTFDKWVGGFFIPMISKTMDALKDGCSFVLNIGSRQYPLSDILTDNFSRKYSIVNKGNLLSGNAGLGKSGDGETFYEITKLKGTH